MHMQNQRIGDESKEAIHDTEVNCDWVTPTKWLLFPYIIGVVWLCLHPIVSITTGEFKCRGYYVDEKALLQNSYTLPSYRADELRKLYSSSGDTDDSGLCHAVKAAGLQRVECHVLQGMEYAIIVSHYAPSVPNESIVLFVKSPSCGTEWTASYFHVALLHMMERLSDGISSTWLSKNIMVVSSSPNFQCPLKNNGGVLSTLVSTFADSYLAGGFQLQHTTSTMRNVLVLDLEQTLKGSIESVSSLDMYILPQGHGGKLPNFDLVSMIVDVFQTQRWFTFQKVRLHIHPKMKWIRQLQLVLKERISADALNYFHDLMSMFAFMSTLTFGSRPPHSRFLDYGIDSLTVQASHKIPKNISNEFIRQKLLLEAGDFVHKIEHMVRAMSNLHEKLHHSVTQYLLLSTTKFVSNAEYIFPVILMLVPLAVRALSIFFKENQSSFEIRVTLVIVSIAWGSMVLTRILLAFHSQSDGSVGYILFSLMYTATLTVMLNYMTKSNFTSKGNSLIYTLSERKARFLSIQLATCCLAIYVHAPLIFLNFSLALPSALWWSPWLAMLRYTEPRNRKWMNILSSVFLLGFAFVTSPPLLLFFRPSLISACETFWILLYSPLHLIVNLLIIINSI